MPYEKYLGLPTLVGKSQSDSFRSILDGVRQRLSNHKVKILSQPGKKVLLKSIPQALPTFRMRVFKLLNSLLRNINRVLQNYWWRQQKIKGQHIGLLGALWKSQISKGNGV